MGLIVAFRVDGDAQPAGSKNAFVPTRKGTNPPEPYRDAAGRIIVNVVDSCKKSPAWKADVGRAAKSAMKGRSAVEGRALKMVLRFVRRRPKNQFGSGRNADVLREDAPPYPIGTPDLTKLIRAAEDGMLGIVYKDDCVVCRQICSKEYGQQPGVFIELWDL